MLQSNKKTGIIMDEIDGAYFDANLGTFTARNKTGKSYQIKLDKTNGFLFKDKDNLTSPVLKDIFLDVTL